MGFVKHRIFVCFFCSASNIEIYKGKTEWAVCGSAGEDEKEAKAAKPKKNKMEKEIMMEDIK